MELTNKDKKYMQRKANKTLHLVLKRKWWDMIESGEKKEEYRDFTPFYIKRLCDKPCFNKQGEIIERKIIDKWTLDACEKRGIDLKTAWMDGNIVPKDYSSVTFHLGYTNNTMTYGIKDIIFGEGRTEWGAESGKGILYYQTWGKD